MNAFKSKTAREVVFYGFLLALNGLLLWQIYRMDPEWGDFTVKAYIFALVIAIVLRAIAALYRWSQEGSQ